MMDRLKTLALILEETIGQKAITRQEPRIEQTVTEGMITEEVFSIEMREPGRVIKVRLELF